MKLKNQPIKPSVIMFYGYPGSGKTAFAKKLSEEIKYAHIDADRLLVELNKGNSPTRSKESMAIITYMANEFLKSGVGVILDLDLPREADRRQIREFAKKHRMKHLVVWLQIDLETAELRSTNRDKRKTEDKFAKLYTRDSFRAYVGRMQNPSDDESIVISGKHTFKSQKAAVIKKLLQKGIIKSEEIGTRIAKPELMSLIPKPTLSGGLPQEKRNISIN